MSNFSLTIGGLVIMVAGTLLVDYGFSDSCSNEITTQIPLIVGGIMAYIGRIRKGDLDNLGFRKD